MRLLARRPHPCTARRPRSRRCARDSSSHPSRRPRRRARRPARDSARRFTADAALDITSYAVAGATPDGRWLAATSSSRRDNLGTDFSREGDPTYVPARRPARLGDRHEVGRRARGVPRPAERARPRLVPRRPAARDARAPRRGVRAGDLGSRGGQADDGDGARGPLRGRERRRAVDRGRQRARLPAAHPRMAARGARRVPAAHHRPRDRAVEQRAVPRVGRAAAARQRALARALRPRPRARCASCCPSRAGRRSRSPTTDRRSPTRRTSRRRPTTT
jgi:hypothetical protein